MQRSSKVSGNDPYTATDPLASPDTMGTVDDLAQSAHQTVDKLSEKTIAQVDRLSGTAHGAVDRAAEATKSAARRASTIPEQAQQMQTKITDAACTSIRARPLASVAGALIAGYLLGRIASR